MHFEPRFLQMLKATIPAQQGWYACMSGDCPDKQPWIIIENLRGPLLQTTFEFNRYPQSVMWPPFESFLPQDPKTS